MSPGRPVRPVELRGYVRHRQEDSSTHLSDFVSSESKTVWQKKTYRIFGGVWRTTPVKMGGMDKSLLI